MIYNDPAVFARKQVTLISFTIVDCDTNGGLISETYHAAEGMTWEEFINSPYNDGNFSVSETNVIFAVKCNAPTKSARVLVSDIISNGRTYVVSFYYVCDTTKSTLPIM